MKNNSKKAKIGKFILLFLMILIIFIIFFVVKSGLWRDLKYQHALYNYNNEHYVSSAEEFKKLGAFKESKFYYCDSLYNYSKQLIKRSDYKKASVQLEIIEEKDYVYYYEDYYLLRDQCYYYLYNAEHKFNSGDYDSVISLLENNSYDKAIELYNKALKKGAILEEKRIMDLYNKKQYEDAFLSWYDSKYKISSKCRTKVINAICKELISIYKNDSIEFYGHLAENKLQELDHKYWTSDYKKWIKAYNDYYYYYYDE